METLAAIHQRRSVRKYQDTPVPDDVLEQILDAGCMAPSAVNLQPWYFVAVKSREQMEALHEVLTPVAAYALPGLKERFPNHPAIVGETLGFLKSLGGAPVCILAFCLKQNYEPVDSLLISQSVAAGIENMLIAATDMGLGSCWLSAPWEAGLSDALKEKFAPDKGELLAVMTFGYAASEIKAPKRKEGRYVII